MIELSELIKQVTEDVPQRNLKPTDSQYERAVLDAVRDFSNRCGRVKRATLSVIAGTATYALPADFLKMIGIISMGYSGGILNTARGLIPVPMGWREDYSIAGREITFFPTPGYTLERNFEYKAGWALTNGVDDYGEGTYADMTEDEARIVSLKAASGALKAQANAVTLDGWKYSIGDESVDKSGQLPNIEVRIAALEKEYLAAVESYNGTAGGQHG